MSKPYFVKKIETKLMLCSKDIQIGDEVQDSDGFKYLIDEDRKKLLDRDNLVTGKHLFTKVFKVIGEISPDALLYITEGIEFDENKVKLYTILIDNCKCTQLRGQIIPECIHAEGNKCLKEKYKTICQIKGQCGHFH